MMDSYITARGSTTGMSCTHLLTINSTSNQAYTINNLDQYAQIAVYVIYSQTYQQVVANINIPIDMLKNSTSSTYIQPTYYDGNGYHCGKIYYNTTDSIYGMISNAYSMEVYGIK